MLLLDNVTYFQSPLLKGWLNILFFNFLIFVINDDLHRFRASH